MQESDDSDAISNGQQTQTQKKMLSLMRVGNIFLPSILPVNRTEYISTGAYLYFIKLRLELP